MALFLAFLLLLFAYAAADCTNFEHHSKSGYFPVDLIPHGACGYGSLASCFNGGKVAAAIPSIYNNGVGCGACFQVRCKEKDLCTEIGTKVIVTHLKESKTMDLTLSNEAFRAMAKDDMGQKLMEREDVDVEYERIPCDFNDNISLRVEEFSNYPEYLAVKVLYQGGQTDIFTIEVAQVGSPNWIFLSRNYGAVWSSNMVPKGPLQLKFVLKYGDRVQFLYAKYNLPADWKPGVAYDTGVQIENSCNPPSHSCHPPSTLKKNCNHPCVDCCPPSLFEKNCNPPRDGGCPPSLFEKNCNPPCDGCCPPSSLKQNCNPPPNTCTGTNKSENKKECCR